MSFRVEPQALRTYAGQLADGQQVADAAGRYVHRYGDFSFHEKGLIGFVAPGHRHLMAALDHMLSHLNDLADGSSQALTGVAADYEHTDRRTAAAIDATYPAVPRPSPSTD